MKHSPRSGRAVALSLLLVLFLAAPAFGQGLGTGITFFVPQSMFQGSGGSLSLEQGLGSSLGLGQAFSLPFGFTYMKVDGLIPTGSLAGEAIPPDSGPWFLADALVAHLMGRFRIEAGPLFLAVEGGLAGSWLVSLSLLGSSVEDWMSTSGLPSAGLESYHARVLGADHRFGWGWQAGGSLGFRFDSFEVELQGLYRNISHRGLFRAELHGLDSDGLSSGEPVTIAENLELLIRGISLGIGANIEF